MPVQPSYREVPVGVTLRNATDPFNAAGTFDATGAGYLFGIPPSSGHVPAKAFLADGRDIGGGLMSSAGALSLGTKKMVGFGYTLHSPLDVREADFVSCGMIAGVASNVAAIGFVGYVSGALAAAGSTTDFTLCSLTPLNGLALGTYGWSGVVRPNQLISDYDAAALDLCAGIFLVNTSSGTIVITGVNFSMEHTHFHEPDLRLKMVQ